MTIEELRAMLGWCSAINLGLLIFTLIILTVFRGPVTGIHAKITGLDEATLRVEYFRYLANFKLFVLIFSLVPYAALRIMA